jgi:hypothetical protein
MMSGATLDLFLSITMLAVFALVAGGIWLLRSRKDTKRGWLMLAAAVVLFGNVLLWSL